MPIRTCLVTGKKGEQSSFFRFTVQKGVLIFDDRIPSPGRGGYVEKTVDSLKKLKKLEKKVSHFLKKKLMIDEKILEDQQKKIERG